MLLRHWDLHCRGLLNDYRARSWVIPGVSGVRTMVCHRTLTAPTRAPVLVGCPCAGSALPAL
jgi:hypothetical protein